MMDRHAILFWVGLTLFCLTLDTLIFLLFLQ